MDSLIKDLSNNYFSTVEKLKNRKDPETIKFVAKEMEAIFLQELIKEMRKTNIQSSENSFGNDMYMGIFDIELSRILSQRGTGLQQMLIQGLTRLKDKHDNNIYNELNNKDKLKSINEVDFSEKRLSSLSPPSPLPLDIKDEGFSIIRGKGETFLLPVKEDKGELD